MKTMYARFAGSIGTLAVATLLVTGAGAQCLGAPSPQPTPHRNNQQAIGHARLIPAAYAPDELNLSNSNPVIVGMWHVKFVAETVSAGVPFPPGTEFDAGYSQWHSDGTELMNSGGRAPITGNFCMGVWAQTGPRTFKLNHLAINWGPDGSSRQGPTVITEEVTVAPNGNSFSGTFTITDYVETDNSNPETNSIAFQDKITGSITGTRVEVTTPASPIF